MMIDSYDEMMKELVDSLYPFLKILALASLDTRMSGFRSYCKNMFTVNLIGHEY